jgi:uncharacterized membrane protein YwzB
VTIVKIVVVWVAMLYFFWERENVEVSEEYTSSILRVEIYRFTTQDSWRAVPWLTVVLVSSPVWAPDQNLLHSKCSWFLSISNLPLRGEDGSGVLIDAKCVVCIAKAWWSINSLHNDGESFILSDVVRIVMICCTLVNISVSAAFAGWWLRRLPRLLVGCWGLRVGLWCFRHSSQWVAGAQSATPVWSSVTAGNSAPRSWQHSDFLASLFIPRHSCVHCHPLTMLEGCLHLTEMWSKCWHLCHCKNPNMVP